MNTQELMPEHEEYMRRAMEVACQNLKRPFGSILVDTVQGEVIAEAVNRSYRNPTAHSELSVIEQASRRGENVPWQDFTLYVTAEPCPMCMAGILWTGIPRVVYGTSMETLRKLGYRHIALSSADVVAAASPLRCELIGGILKPECDALFAAAIRLDECSRA